MSVENSFKLQQQVRENSEELQSYLRDLNSWEKDMKKKEEERKLLKTTDEDNLPPVRNTVVRTKGKSKQKMANKKEKAKEAKRISSFNYKAWEQFDVDTELKKLDGEEKDENSSESSDSDEVLNLQLKKQQAILKKDKGNDFFKKGDYDQAISFYTIGMELDPENPLLPANRAMAFLKKEQFAAAENDCNTCLSLDPSYIKAYLRRATARKALKKFSLEEEDYRTILELEPSNKSAQAELERIKQESERCNVKTASNDTSENSCELLTPSRHLEDLLNMVEFKESDSSSSKIYEKKSVEQSNISKMSINEEPDKPKNTLSESEDFSEIKNVIKKLEQILPPVPKAAFQFLTDWRKLSKYPDLKYQYLKQFPPEKLPEVFKHDMEAEIFCGILETLSSSYLEKQEDIFPVLKYLTQVGRFKTLIMFLSSQEKKEMKKLLESLKNSSHSADEVEMLLKEYRL